MKRIITIFLCLSLILAGCVGRVKEAAVTEPSPVYTEKEAESVTEAVTETETETEAETESETEETVKPKTAEEWLDYGMDWSSFSEEVYEDMYGESYVYDIESEFEKESLDAERDHSKDLDPVIPDSPSYGKDEVIPVSDKNRTRTVMQKFMFKYIYRVPNYEIKEGYVIGNMELEDGRDYGSLGISTRETIRGLKIDTHYGLDDIGMVIKIYRNIFGINMYEFEDPAGYAAESDEVSIEELKVGDIGIYTTNEGEENHIGICAGKYKGIPVFAHIDGEHIGRYQCGVFRLSYLKSVSDEKIDESPAVEFNYFFRPDADWYEEGSREDEDIISEESMEMLHQRFEEINSTRVD